MVLIRVPRSILLALALWVPSSAVAVCHPNPCEPTNIPPTVALSAPTNGASAYAPGSFVVTANANDYDGEIAAVEFFSNNVSIGVDNTEPFSIDYAGLSPGSYSLKAKATDDLGATRVSTTVTVTVSVAPNTPPSITLTSPTGGATGSAPASFVISATASDTDGTVTSVAFKNSGTVLYTDITYPYSYAWSGVTAGSYALSAVATDNNGGTASAAAVNVTVSSAANAAPTVSLTAPSNGYATTTSTQFTLSATAAYSDGTIASVKFLVNGALVGTDTTAPYSASYSASTPGTYDVQALATDSTGVSKISAIANVNVAAPGLVWETRSFVYDDKQRLCKTINPESGATVVDYDAAGNIAWTADGLVLPSTTSCDRELVTAGQKSVRSYDDMSRVTAVSTPGGVADTVTTYYADGAVKSITAANPGGFNVVTSYIYNKRRLLTAETSANGAAIYTLGYGYSANGHLSSIGYPDGETVTYSPDALGRPTLVTGNTATYASQIAYYPSGAMSGFTYGPANGGGPAHGMWQNARQLPTRVRDASASGVMIDDTYYYDANGNVADIIDLAQGGRTTRGMLYDALDRLTFAISTQQWDKATYTYDALDNLRTADQGTRKYRYNYDPGTFRLSNIKDAGGATVHTFGYDTRGNTTAKNSQALVFDSANRLNQVTGRQVYRYDGLGRRVQTTDADTKTTFWIYSQAGQVLYTSEARRSRNLSYIYLNGSQVATRVKTWDNTVAVRYVMTDALGSPVAETNTAGGDITRTSYTPYGDPTPGVDGTGYTGHVMDAGTGFTYMQQRYYDPQIGRFLSSDPMLTDTETAWNFSRYEYAAGNPYLFKDPDGRVIGKFIKGAAEYTKKRVVRRAVENAGRRAVNGAWKMEQKLVAKTGTGTREWTASEKKELLETGRVQGYDGHHMNSKGNDVQLAGNPDNVEFLKNSDHVDTHRQAGGTRAQITGRPLLDRTANGSIPRSHSTDGYAIRTQATNLVVGMLSATATIGEVLDYTDPLTYMFYINDAH